MKVSRIIIAGLCILLLSAAAITAESFLNEDFSAFGIKNIGIYSEGYQDQRVKDFETSYLNAYSSQSVNSFRYLLCDFEGVTPKLMTPDYPVAGSGSATKTDEMIGVELTGYLEKINWETSIIDDFNGGKLSDLLTEAAAENLDAVMVVRYYPIEFFIPFSGYNSIEGYSTITTSANVGQLQKGLGLLPAVELYDTKTGVRLWYSAYFTGHIDGDESIAYQTTVDNASAFFVEDNSPEKKAVETMVDLSLNAGDFPKASKSESRDEEAVAAQAKGSSHMFWTDYPEYDFYGTLLGIGYNFSYVGDFGIYYQDEDARDAQGFPLDSVLVGTAENALMHTMTIPMFTFATGNISFDPGFYFSFMQPISASITYDQYETPTSYPYEPIITTKTADVSVWGLNVGLDFSLKYYLRFSDTLSAFVGGRGLAEMWLVNVSTEAEGLNSYDFEDKVGSLLPLDPFVLNASIIAGVRWDTSAPLEFFAMYTPVGPGGKAMFSAGVNWYGMNFEWTAPHAENVEPMMRW